MEENLTSVVGEWLTEDERNDPHRRIYHLVPEPEDNRSIMELLADLAVTNPEQYEELSESLLKEKGADWIKNLRYDWAVNGRPKQFFPEPRDAWRVLCFSQGRGAGKTRTGSELVKQWVDEHPAGQPPLRIALVGATASDINNTMIAGESGILSVYPEKDRPHWITTNRKLIWYNEDGTHRAIADCFSSEEPSRLRGPQFHKAWVDEISSFRYPEAWDMLMFGLRLGENPQVIVTTTPKPVPLFLDVIKQPTTWVVKGSSYENRANLSPAFFTEVITKYEGSALGRQELEAEIIEEIPDALWNIKNLDKNRVSYDDVVSGRVPEFLSIVLAIDPATTSNKNSAETGMAVVAYGEDDHFYVLHLESYKEQPDDWAKRALKLFEFYRCDKMIAEVNNGGDLVQSIIKNFNPNQKIQAVHASSGKRARADPIAVLYEQNRVHHVGSFTKAEQQMVTFNPIVNKTGLVDCVDALVWGMTWLVQMTQGRSTYRPAVGGYRAKLSNYRRIFP